MPEIVGAEQEAACAAVRDAGLKCQVADERVYSGEAAGTVGTVEPAVGERLLPGEEVTLSLSKGPQEVEMPDFEGEDISNALKEMEELGFAPENLEQNVVDAEDVPPGQVISTDPVAGEVADRESTVTFEVSRGIDVPPVAGRTVDDARQALEALGLTVNIVEVESDSVDKGLVISQNPDTGATLSAGSVVELTVSTGPPGIEIPNVVGMRVREAREALEEAGFKVEVERILGGRIVAEQSHTGKAPEGTEITITATPFAFEEDDDD